MTRRRVLKARAGQGHGPTGTTATAAHDMTVRLWMDETAEQWEQRARVAWEEQTAQGAKDADWFAAAFNLEQLLRGGTRRADCG